MMDMRRLESVLTEEQQRQVEVLKKEDQQREEQERRVRDLEEKRNKLDQEVEQDLRTEVKRHKFLLLFLMSKCKKLVFQRLFKSKVYVQVSFQNPFCSYIIFLVFVVFLSPFKTKMSL